VIWDQRQVNRNVQVSLTFPDTRMQLLAKHPVQHSLHPDPIKASTSTSRKRLPDGALSNS
jgi:hypothetical protein